MGIGLFLNNRLGRSGCNVYYCDNYTSPQHTDDDAVSSLCVQLELVAWSAWKEYAFVQSQHGYYFETTANSLW